LQDRSTDFEFLPIDVSLGRCQRYFTKSYTLTTNPATATNDGNLGLEVGTNVSGVLTTTIFFKNSMRASPTMVGYSAISGASGQWRILNVSRGLNQDATVSFFQMNQNSSLVSVQMSTSSVMGGHYTADAEL
jgi:hypothetical protein